jgi:hypothetical protein
MRTLVTVFASVFALAVAVPVVAFAQPSDPSGSTDPGTGSGAVPTPNTGADDAHVRELVDRELARILNDRAAKNAAKESTSNSPQDITGGSGFMDTRLAFTLTNENVLTQPGETIPSVPGWRFGTPNSLGVLFFDNYDTRYSGFETLSHATMYRDFHKGHFDAEAGFVIKINELSEKNIGLSDDGSYITLSNWKDPDHKDPTRLSLTVFPVSADRFRLGYSYRLSWGGNPEYGRAGSATPGMKVQYDSNMGYVFAGAKSAVVLDRRTAEQRSALAGLFGAGVDPNEMIRLEINGGVFDRGYNELIDVNNQKVILYGASAQVAVHHNMPVQSSIDYKLYKNNNERVSGLFDPVKYPGGLAWLGMAELTALSQTLKDPDKTGVTKNQVGIAGDVNIRIMMDRLRFRFDTSFRDLAFILHSVPSLPTYEDFPSVYKTTPDIFAAAGFDQNWNDLVTLGLIVGVDQPATLTSPVGIPGGTTAGTGTSTAVIRNNNIDTIITILPQNKSAAAQVAVKGSAKVTFGRIYTALLEVFYSYDPNVTRYQRVGCANAQACPDAPFQYVFGDFNQLGINATLQARF